MGSISNESSKHDPLARKSSSDDSGTATQISAEAEQQAGVTLEDLTDLFILESVKQFGPQKFKELHEAKIRPRDVLVSPDILPMKGKRVDMFRTEISSIADETRDNCRRRAVNQILAANKNRAKILTYNHSYYPRNVYRSNNPIPVLYARGPLNILQEQRVVGCVGSRKIRPPYSSLHADFAHAAVDHGFVVVSGFALGADTIGHETAFRNSGLTICVMPCGLEKPFPPENKSLWEEMLASERAIFISEYGFGIRAASLTLRKRNKLIAAFAKGVLIGQSSAKGGAMNAYRFAREQHKPAATFTDDGAPDTTGNKLISEEYKQGDEVFPDTTDLTAYERWLQQLSSSI
jgi:DNA protecting protein DprA